MYLCEPSCTTYVVGFVYGRIVNHVISFRLVVYCIINLQFSVNKGNYYEYAYHSNELINCYLMAIDASAILRWNFLPGRF
jgi:hypothetical protein